MGGGLSMFNSRIESMLTKESCDYHKALDFINENDSG